MLVCIICWENNFCFQNFKESNPLGCFFFAHLPIKPSPVRRVLFQNPGMKKLLFLFFMVLFNLVIFDYAPAQHVPRPHRHARKTVVKSKHRPAKVSVYYPKWNKRKAYHRRWVYFPKYNVYFDNWRGHYVYRNGQLWSSQSVPPPILIRVNLAEVPHRELSAEDDDFDDVYMDNLNHQDTEGK